MIEFYFYIIGFVLFVAIILAFIRTLSTVVHELGHAIPALLFSSGEVKVYIGSYGNPKQSSVFRIGRLTVFYKYDLARLDCGLCYFDVSNLQVFQYFIVVLMGPLFSLFIGFLFLYLSFYIENWFSVKVIFFIYFISSFYDFYINIKPIRQPILLYDGTITYNDGSQIKRILSEGQQIIDFAKVAKSYDARAFEEAAAMSKELIDSGYEKEEVYRIAELSFIFSTQFEAAEKLITQFKEKFGLKYEDYVIIGLWHDEQEEYDLAINAYDKAIALESSDAIVYNNKGYAYIMMEEYSKGLVELKKSLELNPLLNYAILNEGLALIHLDQLEEGVAKFKKVLEEEAENPYAIGGIGIYHYLKGNYIEAQKYLEASLAIDSKTKIVNQYLNKCRIELKS